MPKSTAINHELLRLAVRLEHCLAAGRTPVPFTLPQTQWLECQRLERLLRKAIQHGWYATAKRLRPRLMQAIQTFQYCLEQRLAEHQQPTTPMPTLRDLYGELVGLFEEFPSADYDLRQNSISVSTDAITLEDFYLGPFSIELMLGQDGSKLSYAVTATDPIPASNNSEVTHPHVSNDILCEGEGILPIRRALGSGRLADCFQIVEQILHTYSPGSAYVSLKDWNGVTCAACGESLADDEGTSCSRTDEALCDECAVTCTECEYPFAPDHIDSCNGCSMKYCENCLNEGYCNDCRAEAQEKETCEQLETPPGGCGGCADQPELTAAVAPAIG